MNRFEHRLVEEQQGAAQFLNALQPWQGVVGRYASRSPSPRPSPRGEGETFARCSTNRTCPDCNHDEQTLLPLPKGEGRGEGKGIVQLHDRTINVLRPVPSAGNAIPQSNSKARAQGSILIIVLWIVFGLVSITLYFANSMTFELRASDNRVAGIEAEQAIEGARRYFSCVLSNLNAPGVMPDPQTYLHEAVPVGNARFWVIGRSDATDTPTIPHFGLMDESAKMNLNSASSNMLINLPRMTPELVANILAWRSTNTSSLAGGAESDIYMSQQPPYLCKNAPFESVEELRLVYNMDMDILYGEDANLNGALDPNENDGDVLPPTDNLNGQLDPGLLEYVTVYSREPSTYTNATSSGSATNANRINISTPADFSRLSTLLIQQFGETRARQIYPQNSAPIPFTSPLQFFMSRKVSVSEIAQIETAIRGARIVGLINVNTASAAVLACIPGLDSGQAAQLTAYRQANTNTLNGSIGWVTQVLNATNAATAGPYLTGKSYQYMADIAAIGHNGRGYRRTRFIFDTSKGAPVILRRQDLSQLGWALGKDVRDKWLMAKQTP